MSAKIFSFGLVSEVLSINLIVAVEDMIIEVLLFEFFEKEAIPNSDLLSRRRVLEFIDITLFVIYVERIKIV